MSSPDGSSERGEIMNARMGDYPTGDASGALSAGPRGYRVVSHDGIHDVMSYSGTRSSIAYDGSGLSEGDAHRLAARLSEHGN